jgi:hypothetical protein
MQDSQKHKNFKLTKTDLKNSLIEGNYSIENQISRSLLRKKKLSAESYPNSI